MKTGLVLSGGGARGFAHIGVTKALLEKGYTFDAISGTSAGAMIGVFLADGFSPDEIRKIFLSHELMGIFNFITWGTGLSLDRLKKLLEANLRSKTFEELKTPFYVNATDYTNGNQRLFSTGELITPIIASASIPVIFPPVYIQGIPYVDGGISSNLPVEALHDKVDKLIGVSVNPPHPYNEKASVAEKTDRVMHMGLRCNTRPNIPKCDLFIEPPGLCRYHLFDSKKIEAMIAEGYEYTTAQVEKDFTLKEY